MPESLMPESSAPESLAPEDIAFNAELAFASVHQQVEWLRAGDCSPLELTTLYLERIERLDGKLGSYFAAAAEGAIADAQYKTEQLTRARQQGETLPFLFGIPVSIKDINAVDGLPLSYGVAALKDQKADRDDGSIQQIKRNGLVILGKTALSQLAAWPYSEPPGFSPSRNPWNLAHTSGGSSGGAAAAVAAGLCSVAHGSDGGGSIRGPAFCCGIVGIKPSRGRISAAPLGESLGGLATQGPLGRTVADAAALLDAMAGALLGDPYGLPAPVEPFWAIAQRTQTRGELTSRSKLQPALKLAFATDFPGFPSTATPCREAVQQAMALLESGGAIASEITLEFLPLVAPFTQVWLSAVAAAGLPRAVLEPMNQWLLDRAPTAAQYIQAQQALQMAARAFSQQLLPYDALILPTYLAPPIALGAWQDLSPEVVMQNIVEWIAPCPLANVTGQPAIALPTGFSEAGLPVGIQIVAPLGQEATAIEIAAYLEAQMQFPNWVDRCSKLEQTR